MSELCPKLSASTYSFDPHDDPMKEMLYFSPYFSDGSTKVQEQLRYRKWNSQDLNPDGKDPEAMPASTMVPLSHY